MGIDRFETRVGRKLGFRNRQVFVFGIHILAVFHAAFPVPVVSGGIFSIAYEVGAAATFGIEFARTFVKYEVQGQLLGSNISGFIAIGTLAQVVHFLKRIGLACSLTAPEHSLCEDEIHFCKPEHREIGVGTRNAGV